MDQYDQSQHSSSQETGIEEITDAELIRAFIEEAKIDLHTAMPCKVMSYDVGSQTVSVSPALYRAVPDGDGNYLTEPLPQLDDVPVGFMAGGGFAISLPVSAGDYGLLIFCERNIGSWRGTGNQGDPGDLGMHTLDGAVFLPCVRPDNAALSSADASNMVLGSDTNGNGRIVIKPGEIDLGAAVNSFIARADKVISHLTAINNLLANCTPAGVETGLAAIKVLAQGLQTAGFADVATTNAKVP